MDVLHGMRFSFTSKLTARSEVDLTIILYATCCFYISWPVNYSMEFRKKTANWPSIYSINGKSAKCLVYLNSSVHLWNSLSNQIGQVNTTCTVVTEAGDWSFQEYSSVSWRCLSTHCTQSGNECETRTRQPSQQRSQCLARV